MCSRFILQIGDAINLSKRLGIPLGQMADARDRFNIAPATPVAAMRRAPQVGGLNLGETVALRWGLIPHWVREGSAPSAPLINARAETVPQKPSFREAWRRRQRCVLPTSGFYEWEKQGRERLPWLFKRADDGPLAFAGLWDRWTDPINGEVIESCTVLTTTPNALLSRIHDRMPVLLDEQSAATWLDPELDEVGAAHLMRPFDAARMEATALDTYVNSTAHDDPACLTLRGRSAGAQFDLGI